MITAVLLVMLATVKAEYDAFHPFCEINATYSMDCLELFPHINDTVKSFKTMDPAHGEYKWVQSNTDTFPFIRADRMNTVQGLTDQVQFYFDIQKDGTCVVTGRSVSTQMAYWDDNVNYCNVVNVLRKTRPAPDSYAPTTCKWVPENISVCNVV